MIHVGVTRTPQKIVPSVMSTFNPLAATRPRDNPSALARTEFNDEFCADLDAILELMDNIDAISNDVPQEHLDDMLMCISSIECRTIEAKQAFTEWEQYGRGCTDGEYLMLADRSRALHDIVSSRTFERLKVLVLQQRFALETICTTPDQLYNKLAMTKELQIREKHGLQPWQVVPPR